MNGSNQHGIQDIHPRGGGGHTPRHSSAVVFLKVRKLHSGKHKSAFAGMNAFSTRDAIAAAGITLRGLR
jgi:hypothetical protein